MKAWLKGGLWGGLILFVLGLLGLFFSSGADAEAIGVMLYFFPLTLMILAGFFIIGFILGSLIGLLVSWVKNKK